MLRKEQRLAAWEQGAAHKSFALHACSKHCELGVAWFPEICELQVELQNECAEQDSSLYAVLFVGHLVLREEQRLAAWEQRAAHKSFVLHACSEHCKSGVAWFPEICEL